MAIWTVYGTTVDINDVMSTGTHLDTLSILNGGTVIVNTSPKFLINQIQITEGRFHINGAGATSPINICMYQGPAFYGPDASFTSSKGWWTVGTAAGTANQVIDMSNYFFKDVTGGSQMTDVLSRAPGLWVESGQILPFTGGTGSLPSENDYVYQIPYNGGTTWAPILSVGTSTGDPTQGTLTTKWFSGTFVSGSAIEIRKVVDMQGKVFDTSWRGTCGSPSLAPGTLAKWQNFENTGYNNALTQYTRNDVFSRGFIQRHDRTTGTFGDDTYGVIPQAGALIKAPIITLNYVDTFNQLITGTTLTGVTTKRLSGSDPGYGVVDLKGVSLGNLDLQYTNNRVTLESCSFSRLYYDPSFSSYVESLDISDIIVSQTSAATALGLSYSGLTSSPLIDDIYIVGNYNATPLHSITATILPTYLTNSTISTYRDATAFSPAYLPINLVPQGEVNILNCISRGRYRYDCARSIIKNCKFLGISTAPFFESSSTPWLQSSEIENIETIYSNYNRLTSNTASIGGAGIFNYIKAVGHRTDTSHRPRMSLSQSATTFEILKIYRTYLYTGATLNPVASSIVVDPSDPAMIADFTNITAFPSSKLNYYYFRMRGHNYGYNEATAGALITSSQSRRSNGPFFYDALNTTTGTSGYIGVTFNNFKTSGVFSPAVFLSVGTETSPVTLLYSLNDPISAINAGVQLTVEQDYFTLGHNGFNGRITFSDTNTTIGGSDWSGGTCNVEFQYDTSGDGGTGFNGDWLYARTPDNWTGLSVDPALGVKLKYRLTTYSTAANRVLAIHTHTLIPSNFQDYVYPVDQQLTTITLLNVVVGSRYYIYNSTKGTLLTSSEASDTTVTYFVNSTNADNGDTLLIRVRKTSSGTKYLPFETNAIVSGYTSSTFVSQVIDTIIT